MDKWIGKVVNEYIFIYPFYPFTHYFDLNQDFFNQIFQALVTGASVGIGADISLALANLGMIVVGIARRSDLIEVF